MRREGVPYVMIGGTRFYDRAEVKDALSWLRLLVNPKDYRAYAISGGLDFNFYGKSGVGAEYAYLYSKQGDLATSEQHYINVGATWWVIDYASVSLRYAKLITMTDGKVADGNKDKDSFFLVLRLVI